MITSLMLYGIAVAALLSIAAWLGERSLNILDKPARFVWLLALCGSAIVPIALISTGLKEQVPSQVGTFISEAWTALPSEMVQVETPTTESNDSTSGINRRLTLPTLDQSLIWIWIIATLSLLVYYAAGWLGARRASTRWQDFEMDGHIVANGETVGPAIFGFVRPRIVVPSWLMEMSRTEQRLVIAHEREHLIARDSQVLLVALSVVVLFPWNLPLWWQLRRLRLAVEVDCDARVLRQGADPVRYAQVLLDVGQRFRKTLPQAIALIEPRSDLERRIRRIVRERVRFGVVAATACGALCVAVLVLAAQVQPPSTETADRSAPTAPVDDDTRQMLEAMEAAFSDPESRPGELENQKAKARFENPEVAQALGLSSAQETALISELAERGMQEKELWVPLGLKRLSQAEFGSAIDQLRAASDQRLVQILGEAKFQEYQRYRHSTPERQQLRYLRVRLDEKDALTPAQAKQLVDTMQEERERHVQQLMASGETSGYRREYPFRAAPKNMTDPAAILKFMEEDLVRTKAFMKTLHNRASEILTKEQLRRFDEMQEEQFNQEQRSVDARRRRLNAAPQ
jgi:beta-lactamase regulating signal transducer with metallopeptidase domain